MTGFILTLGVLTVIYLAALLWIFLGLDRLRLTATAESPFVSVVVAARNEQENIPQLLNALTQQSYPADRYEIIIVDDQSTDLTASMVARPDDERIQLLQTANRHQIISHKKNAINLGIQKARGEIILLTDADCRPPAYWVEGIVRLFTPDVGMVIGFSPCELPRLSLPFGYLLALESLSLAAIAAGTAGWGVPATCNGRNLAYRKKVYQEVGGFAKIQNFISGDDDLMLKLVQRTRWHIRYAYTPQLVVPTMLVRNIVQFAHQRLRHASKGFHYDPQKVIGLLILYVYNLLLLAIVPLALLQQKNLWAPALFIGLKAISEFVVLFRFAAKMKRLHYLIVFPLAELLHVPYVVIFGALGQFIKFKWKEKTDSHA
ncbi:glycosyltransferase [candidate division KSB1 bacterium]|nr:glycosyltransferase [candidate division KSB1 bacterium]